MKPRQHVPILVAAAALIGVLSLPKGADAALNVAKPVISQEVVVKLVQPDDLAGIASAYRLDPTPLGQFGSHAIYRLRISDSSNPVRKAQELLADTRVLYAEPNYVSSIPESGGRVIWEMGSMSDAVPSQWAAEAMRLPEAHVLTRGEGVSVAVLDTGVDLAHPDLASHLEAGYDFVDSDADVSEGNAAGAAYGHGTHVAGLVHLAAPGATIVPYRVLDANGEGNTWVLAEAILHAANPDGNPETDDGVDIINLSLGAAARSRLLNEVIREVTCVRGNKCASASGVVVVAAAGNNGTTMPLFPAAAPVKGVIAVAATNAENQLASFSNYGRWVTVAAPGEGILSTTPGGYATWSGTSMAAPLVAGEAALVRSIKPELSPRQVADHIANTAVPLVPYLGLGRADATAALYP